MGNAMDEVINLDAILKRRLAWDILPCPTVPKYIKLLGMVPGSDGGDELEHVQSHHRINRLAPIVQDVDAYSQLAGEVAGRAILENQGIEIEAQSEEQIQHYSALVTGSTRAVIANLIDNGVLHIGGHP